MTYQYYRPIRAMKYNGQDLLADDHSRWENYWEPSVPDDSATLWRYMSFAKFCSLLGRKALFFSLVRDMEDKYEGFIYPPMPRDHDDPLQPVENQAHEVLRACARASLISCWTESDHESNLMWKAYAGSEGIAIRTSFHRLEESIRPSAELPIKFGKVEYVDQGQNEVPRLGWAPLFHKRTEYREEEEVRAALPSPPYEEWANQRHPGDLDIPLDQDVAEQRGRYIPVNLDVLVQEVLVPPRATPWFTRVVESTVGSSSVRARVTRSSIERAPVYRVS